jgi:imidazoleglycerol-phosphate dehydratase
MERRVIVRRKTSETDVKIILDVYGKGVHTVRTGISFLDHMLGLFAKHGLFDLKIAAVGDLDVDIHHTNEDVAITLGEAFARALDKKAGIKRFGDATVPMDEALVRVAVDVSGRPFLVFASRGIKAKDIKDYSLNYAEQFLRSFVTKAGMTVHVDVLDGRDLHHILEAVFKAFAKALLRAVEREPRAKGVPSTKGSL